MTISKQHNKNYNHSTFIYDGIQYAYDAFLLLFSAFYKELSKYSSNTNQYFFYINHLGSSSWITYTDGSVTQHLQSLPFGEPFIDQRATSYDIRFKFTGKEMDTETGYQYFGARYYDSDLSVWLSLDPLADKYPMISSYAYVFNNPINLIDRWGLEGENPEKFGLGKKIGNWVSGNAWRNKANKIIGSNSNYTNVKDNGDNITSEVYATSNGYYKNGYYTNQNESQYKFSENGVEVVTTDSRTGKSTTTQHTWKSFLSKNHKEKPFIKGSYDCSRTNFMIAARDFERKFYGNNWSSEFRDKFERGTLTAVRAMITVVFPATRIHNLFITVSSIPCERKDDEDNNKKKLN